MLDSGYVHVQLWALYPSLHGYKLFVTGCASFYVFAKALLFTSLLRSTNIIQQDLSPYITDKAFGGLATPPTLFNAALLDQQLQLPQLATRHTPESKTVLGRAHIKLSMNAVQTVEVESLLFRVRNKLHFRNLTDLYKVQPT